MLDALSYEFIQKVNLFKRRVIEQAQKELVHTDMSFTFREIKINKKVVMDKADKVFWHSLPDFEKSKIRKYVFGGEFIKNTSFQTILDKCLDFDCTSIFENKAFKKAHFNKVNNLVG